MFMDDLVSRTLAWAHPSSGDNLTGFMMDADHAFESTEIFDSVHVDQTGDPSRLLVIRLVAKADGPTLPSIVSALREAWTQLAYTAFQATVIERYRDATVMKFVTATGDGGLCVTGEAIATSPTYHRLVTDFEEQFPFAGPIKTR